jgi:hypothetical protein
MEVAYKPVGMFKSSWSSDGRLLLHTGGQFNAADLWVVPLEGDRKPMPLRTEFNESMVIFLPTY